MIATRRSWCSRLICSHFALPHNRSDVSQLSFLSKKNIVGILAGSIIFARIPFLVWKHKITMSITNCLFWMEKNPTFDWLHLACVWRSLEKNKELQLFSNHGSASCLPRAEGPNSTVFLSLDFWVTFHHPDVTTTTTQPRRRRWNECCRFTPPPPSSWPVLECLWCISITPHPTPHYKKETKKIWKKKRKWKETSPLLSKEQKKNHY